MKKDLCFRYMVSCRKYPGRQFRVYLYVPVEDGLIQWMRVGFSGCDEEYSGGKHCDDCGSAALGLMIQDVQNRVEQGIW